MNHIIRNVFFIILAWLVVLPFNTFSQSDESSAPKLPNPLQGKFTSLVTFIDFILNNIVLPIGAVVAVFFLVYSGFLFVSAQGNEEKLKTAKAAFLWTLVGIAVLLGATVISTGIKNTVCQIAPQTPGLCP